MEVELDVKKGSDYILSHILTGRKYYAKHIPSNEDWVILGVSKDKKSVCAAGWPPTMADCSHMIFISDAGELTEKEKKYRNKEFGDIWI